jgi:hypothetical protein
MQIHICIQTACEDKHGAKATNDHRSRAWAVRKQQCFQGRRGG